MAPYSKGPGGIHTPDPAKALRFMALEGLGLRLEALEGLQAQAERPLRPAPGAEHDPAVDPSHIRR
jgi:hypothetical protein